MAETQTKIKTRSKVIGGRYGYARKKNHPDAEEWHRDFNAERIIEYIEHVSAGQIEPFTDQQIGRVMGALRDATK